MPEIQCHYCGGTHADAAAIKQCWKDTQPGDTAQESHRAPFLGRSVVISRGDPVPEAWAGCPLIAVHEGAGPADSAFQAVESAYLNRTPVVIELEGGLDREIHEMETSPPWSLDPGFSFVRERLAHAVWSNSFDARLPASPSWAPTEAAVQLGALRGGSADVSLPDGRPALVDGGPLQFFATLGDLAAGTVLIPRITLEHERLTGLGTNSCDAELAEDQLLAVTHPSGSARIIAPAGSGKTRVLTERARHLLRAWNIPAPAVCLVAFNKRAADEMKQRTSDLPDLQIRTLNSLALAIVSGTGQFGGGRSVDTIDERGVRQVLDTLVTYPRRLNTDPAAAWIEALSSVRLGLRSPAAVEAEFGGDVDGLQEVFEKYRTALRERGVLDFDEQIYSAIEVLLTNPEVRRRARRACRVMLVDEFQDLTPAHLLLIRLLSGPGGSVFGVGDDDQTIYGYAGASPDWLINYRHFFPSAGAHALQINYRCPPEVVTAARTLLTHNRRRVEKVMVPAPRRQAADGLLILAGEDPVETTVGAVRDRLSAGVDPTQLAVLTRVNNSLAPIQLGLDELGIPVNHPIDTRFLERTGIKAALAWLRMVAAPGALKAGDIGLTARRPPRALSPRAIEWMSEQRSLPRIRALASRLGDRDRIKVDSYADDVEALAELAASGATADILRTLRDRIGLAAAMAALDTEHRRLDRSAQTDDLDVLVAIARLHPDPAGFELWLKAGLSTPGDPHGVTLATIHAVKGREWSHVVLHDVSQGLLPHRLAADVEEERRVFHVGLTRCRGDVTVVAGTPPSQFLQELQTEWTAPAAGEIPLPAAWANGRPAPQKVQVGRSPSAEVAARMLREWRIAKARSEGRPAFTIMHDSTLETLASSSCRSLGDLARVKGIGPAKLESFGDEILAVLEAAEAETSGGS
ncbi:MAG: ATP-dependent DNA helicase UvrD2 [Actinomycetota bacterium]